MTRQLNNDNGLQARWTRTPAPNSGLAKVAVSFSGDSFVVNQTLVLRIKFSGENRHLRQARKTVKGYMRKYDPVTCQRLGRLSGLY